MLEDDKFKSRIFELMEEEVILKFKDKTGDASDFYNIEGEESEGA